MLESQLQAEPNRYVNQQVRKGAGEVLEVKSDDAASYGLGQEVSETEDLKGIHGLRGKPIRIDGPTWVDSLVTILTDPFVSWVLLFIGLFMLVLELKLPGIGLPAITSALAFLLFFWSHYLSGTADQLEIILFLVGLVSLALELFVFPGFGVFGMSGILLILTSIVMASHTFVWPTQEYEYREMGYSNTSARRARPGHVLLFLIVSGEGFVAPVVIAHQRGDLAVRVGDQQTVQHRAPLRREVRAEAAADLPVSFAPHARDRAADAVQAGPHDPLAAQELQRLPEQQRRRVMLNGPSEQPVPQPLPLAAVADPPSGPGDDPFGRDHAGCVRPARPDSGRARALACRRGAPVGPPPASGWPTRPAGGRGTAERSTAPRSPAGRAARPAASAATADPRR